MAVINKAFPHWFDDNFKKFSESVDRIPFDQNCLVALCAPRPVLYTNGIEDQWANPDGQFEMLKAASPVYKLLGAEGVGAAEMPPIGKLVDSRLGYYVRTGPHVSDPDYWKTFLITRPIFEGSSGVVAFVLVALRVVHDRPTCCTQPRRVEA